MKSKSRLCKYCKQHIDNTFHRFCSIECKDDYKAMMKRNHEKRKSPKQIFTDWIEGLG